MTGFEVHVEALEWHAQLLRDSESIVAPVQLPPTGHPELDGALDELSRALASVVAETGSALDRRASSLRQAGAVYRSTDEAIAGSQWGAR